MSKKCKNCGSENASISFGILNRSCVEDGRLKTTDVDGMFFIGCDDCSETIGKISPMNFVEAAQKVGDELDASKAQLATLTAQRDKAVELISELESYIKFLNSSNDEPIHVALVYGWQCEESIVLEGAERRDKIQKLKDELTGGSDE